MKIKKSLNRAFAKLMMEVCHGLKLQNAFLEVLQQVHGKHLVTWRGLTRPLLFFYYKEGGFIMSTIYIHYGSDKFDRTRFGSIKNRAIPWVKPEGRSGLWACRVDTENSWKEYCEQDALWPDKLKESFKFKLSKKAKVVYLNKPSDCDKLPLYKNDTDSIFFDRTVRYIDFEKCVKKGIDAIEVVDIWGREDPDHYDHTETLYYALYGWDCDSILILNPDIVEEV